MKLDLVKARHGISYGAVITNLSSSESNMAQMNQVLCSYEFQMSTDVDFTLQFIFPDCFMSTRLLLVLKAIT